MIEGQFFIEIAVDVFDDCRKGGVDELGFGYRLRCRKLNYDEFEQVFDHLNFEFGRRRFDKRQKIENETADKYVVFKIIAYIQFAEKALNVGVDILFFEVDDYAFVFAFD